MLGLSVFAVVAARTHAHAHSNNENDDDDDNNNDDDKQQQQRQQKNNNNNTRNSITVPPLFARSLTRSAARSTATP